MCCFSCLLQLLRHPLSLTAFSYNFDGELVYYTPLSTVIYDEYCKEVSIGHVVLVNFYSDRKTVSKSWTQVVTFINVRIANIRPHYENWFAVEVAPTHTSIPSTLPDEKKQPLKLQVLHRSIFVMFRSLIRPSFTGFVENGCTYFPQLPMVIVDKSEEWSLMSLKRLGSDTDCSYLTLRSRIRTVQNPPRS